MRHALLATAIAAALLPLPTAAKYSSQETMLSPSVHTRPMATFISRSDSRTVFRWVTCTSEVAALEIGRAKEAGVSVNATYKRYNALLVCGRVGVMQMIPTTLLYQHGEVKVYHAEVWLIDTKRWAPTFLVEGAVK